MGKGSYLGGHTTIGPHNPSWFGNGEEAAGARDDADQIARRVANPLTAEAENRIKLLQVHVTGLSAQVAKLEDQLSRSRQELAELLYKHGLSDEPERAKPADPATPSTPPATGKTTRHQRRKKARARQQNA